MKQSMLRLCFIRYTVSMRSKHVAGINTKKRSCGDDFIFYIYYAKTQWDFYFRDNTFLRPRFFPGDGKFHSRHTMHDVRSALKT